LDLTSSDSGDRGGGTGLAKSALPSDFIAETARLPRKPRRDDVTGASHRPGPDRDKITVTMMDPF
jgi:hypothetical protein